MSAAPLLALDSALQQLLAAVPAPPTTERVPLADAAGRILALEQRAVLDVPPWDNSAMDGYAVEARHAGALLPVAQTIAAGEAPGQLAAGTAARIFTGAPVPAGADAVVLQEDCERIGGDVHLPTEVRPAQHIRRRGDDTQRGAPLLRPGRRLRPQDLGLLAGQGVGAVEVFRRLEVALLCTGSELREPGSGELAPGQIYNSNRPMLAALLRGLGCRVLDLGIVPDDPQATAAALQRAAGADAVLSSGGVSVGEADYVREEVTRHGAVDLWRLAIKPGKPFAFGRVHDTPFLGLPGNPVSAFVTFVILAAPWLRAAQGSAESAAPRLPARADFAVERPGRREEYLRATLSLDDGELWARPLANQSSGVLSSVATATALAVVPAGATLQRGDRVEVLTLDSLLGSGP